MSSPTTSKILIDNLTAFHKAREASVASESSEKIRRALKHNLRTSADIKYVTGDSVYFKRVSENTVYIGILIPPSKTPPPFFAKPPLKSANCPSTPF